MRKLFAVALVSAAAVTGIAIGAVAGSGSPRTVATAHVATATATAPAPVAARTTQAAAPVTTQAAAPVTTPAAPVSSAPAAMTGSQQQAVNAAQDYLSLGQGFSKEGLTKQLTSKYGSGFSQADAAFAVNYLSPDWNAQAVLAAKGYLALGTGFSRASLIQQLTSVYGSGFTESQAEYAATKAGL